MDDRDPPHTSLGRKGIKLACGSKVRGCLNESGLSLGPLKVLTGPSPLTSQLCFLLCLSVSCKMAASIFRLTSTDFPEGRQRLLPTEGPVLAALSAWGRVSRELVTVGGGGIY